MGLFGGYSQHEKQLLDTYTSMAGREAAEHWLKIAIESAKNDGTYRLPGNLGDILLGRARTDDSWVAAYATKMQPLVQLARDDGATDEDIRAWWNMSEVERRMVQLSDEAARLALAIDRLEKGDSMEAAKAVVWKFHERYGIARDTAEVRGDDRPLPIELKDRVNRYTLRRASSDAERYKADLEASTTCNALIRREIRAGRL